MAKNRARRTREFLECHPICIFCGGVARATTIDHVPSRQLFHLKEWPEGYEFPSCHCCDQATKDAEQMMALISRIGPDSKSAAERDELKRIMKAVRNNYPDLLREMRATPEQIAAYRSKPWLMPLANAGLAAREPFSLRGPTVTRAAEVFARKLFTALHYKEFGKIIPPEGGMIWRWFSNVQRMDGAMPDELLQVMGGRPTIRRTRHDLSDQFSYSYVKIEDGELTGYFAMFRKSFAMLGFLDLSATQLAIGIPDVTILRPLTNV